MRYLACCFDPKIADRQKLPETRLNLPETRLNPPMEK
jgi:hypothetical protein